MDGKDIVNELMDKGVERDVNIQLENGTWAYIRSICRNGTNNIIVPDEDLYSQDDIDDIASERDEALAKVAELGARIIELEASLAIENMIREDV